MTTEPDAYAVLQVVPHALDDVVHAAYRALARRYHPDGSAPHPERMIEINRAWERLRTAERRRAYDVARARRPVAVGPGTAGVHAPWQAAGPSGAPDRGADVLDFGRYEGWRIADIARHDPNYLRWLSRHSAGIRYLDAIARHLPGEPLGRRMNAIG